MDVTEKTEFSTPARNEYQPNNNNTERLKVEAATFIAMEPRIPV
jgi:hypothetical protein